MKIIFSILLIVILSLFLVACGISTSERSDLTDNAIASGDSDVIIEETKMTWPKDTLPKSVPELKRITITDITDIENGILITFEDCNQDETKLYINQLKNAGWDYITVNNDIGKTVTASKQNETLIFISSPENGTGSISYSNTD